MLIIMTLWSVVLLFIRPVNIKFILAKIGGGKQIMYFPNWGIYWYIYIFFCHHHKPNSTVF
jgi:hypothetical protein